MGDDEVRRAAEARVIEAARHCAVMWERAAAAATECSRALTSAGPRGRILACAESARAHGEHEYAGLALIDAVEALDAAAKREAPQ